VALTDDRAARQDVADVLVRYATGIDRRDWELFRTCFTDDCVADYGDIGVWHGANEITAWMDATHAPMGHTMHRITNQAVTPTADGMAARSYVHVILQVAGNVIQGYGFYDDELVETDAGWKIARRRFTPVFLRMNLGGS
jgi:3-phenylpropionate/cinnamic acid dioxygenase small subunit